MSKPERVPRFLKGITPTVAWLLLILYLSTYGVKVNLPEPVWNLFKWDKLVHAIMYGILATLMVWAIEQRRPVTKGVLTLVFVLSTAYGTLMEIIQYSFFPNRSFEILDIIANIIGISVSISVIYFFYIKKPR